MMPALMYVAAVALNLPVPAAAKIAARCYGSPFSLGTSNIPLDDTVAHSVVAINVFLRYADAKPVGWLYKNKSQATYLQLSGALSPGVGPNWGIDGKFLQRSAAGTNFLPALVTPQEQIRAIATLLAHGNVLVGCFTGDLPMKGR